MRVPRALVAGLLSLLCIAGFVAAAPPTPAQGQLGAVRADKDGWWDRSKGGGLPLTSPALPFPVSATGLAISASNGEPEKAAAVGIALDIDPARFQRLLLNLAEVADNGDNVGVQVAAIRACPIKTGWVGSKGAAWPPPSLPAASEVASCVAGARSTDGVWSFDLTALAREWLAGTRAPNGVLLVEDVSAPVSFQVVVGDRTTSGLRFSVDVLAEDDLAGGGGSSSDTGSSGTGDTSGAGSASSSDTVPAVTTYEYTAADSFTVPVAQPGSNATAAGPRPTLAPAPRTTAGGTGTLASQRSPSLTGGLPLALVLLLPLGLALAFLLARALGPAGEPAATTIGREGPVSRALASRHQEGTR
ncbi:MAG: hypothetical protein QOF60_2608 [Actinomycetota bacterium]|jgi:hypothetical protein|nr:hypothetical protein [Actinomycetota bacterium]